MSTQDEPPPRPPAQRDKPVTKIIPFQPRVRPKPPQPPTRPEGPPPAA